MPEKRDRLPVGKLTSPFDGRRNPTHLGLAVLRLHRLDQAVTKIEQANRNPTNPTVLCGFSQKYAARVRIERDKLRRDLEKQVGSVINDQAVVAEAVQAIEQKTGFPPSRIRYQ